MSAAFTHAVHATMTGLPASCRELFSRCAPALQFDQTLQWYDAFARSALDVGHELRVVTLEDEAGRSCGALPLRDASKAFGGGAVVLQSLSNFYTSLFSPIFDPGFAVDRLAEATVSALRALRWDVLDLQPLACDAPGVAALQRALQVAGIPYQLYFRFANWYLEVGGRSFDDYFATLPGQLRSTLARREKKLRKAGQVELEIIEDSADLERALAAYSEIYGSSWKRPEPFPEFIPVMTRALAEMGWLRLGVVWLDREPAAAQLWFVKDRVASIFKLAYKEKFADYSPGSFLTSALMRLVIDRDQVGIVDYLSGDDAYKRDWMSHRRERFGMLVFNSTIRGRLSRLRHEGGALLKRVLSRTRRAAEQYRAARLSGSH